MEQIEAGQDIETRDRRYAPGMLGLSFSVESSLVHGTFYYPQGEGSRPTVVLCHGFPGFEKNADIAHILRRAGFNVLMFSYRGAWGSQGDFTFSHVSVDARRAVTYLTSDLFPEKARVNPNTIVLAGFSMGGFAAMTAAAKLPNVKNIAFVSGWNIGRNVRDSRTSAGAKARIDAILSGAAVLNGVTAAALWNEMYYNEKNYDLCELAPQLADKNIMMVGAQRDMDVPMPDNHVPLVDALKAAGANVTEKIFDTDHCYSDMRLGLAKAMLDWLAESGF